MTYPYAHPLSPAQHEYGMHSVHWHSEARLEDEAHTENRRRDQADRSRRAAVVSRSARATRRRGGAR